MRSNSISYKRGDLVHIPQAVTLIDCEEPYSDAQLTIPLRMERTTSPRIAVITRADEDSGYVKVYCDGDIWSVKNENVYSLGEREEK